MLFKAVFGFLIFVGALSFAQNSQSTIRKIENLPASRILKPKISVRNPTVTLQRSIKDYVNGVVSSNGVGHVIESGIAACSKNPRHQCVVIQGVPCPQGTTEDCEGMALVIKVDVTTGLFDSGYDSMGPIYDQADIERHLEIAP